MTLYSWKCTECRAKGKRWVKMWHGGKIGWDPFGAAGRHADICPNRKNNLRGEHPHRSCPNHMIVSRGKP